MWWKVFVNSPRADTLYFLSSPADERLLWRAPKWQLNRLRKQDLIRLLGVAGLGDAEENVTRPEIIARLLEARTRQSRGRQSSETSSNDGGAEEDSDGQVLSPQARRRTNLPARRATERHTQSGVQNPVATRSASMGNLAGKSLPQHSKASSRLVLLFFRLEMG